MSEQMSLFDDPSLNPVPRVKEAMRRAVKACGLSRDQVADKINDLARIEGISTNGRSGEVSSEILDKWLAASADHLIPWKLLLIFCRVTESIDPLRALVAPIGAQVIDREEAVLLKWAKADWERRKIVRQQKRLEQDIGI